MTNNNFIIYTDGCCLGNPGKGGIGALIFQNSTSNPPVEISKGYKITTNNRMELLAAITALEYITTPSNITLSTDSNYVVSAINNKWLYGWITGGWKTASRKPVKNRDLWESLYKLISTHTIKFIWVKGHASNKFNNRCDELANMGARQSDLISDTNYKEDI